jgi:hypothetical protein
MKIDCTCSVFRAEEKCAKAEGVCIQSHNPNVRIVMIVREHSR